jgi:hypothetical protein
MHSLRHVFHQQVRPSRPRACSCSPRITLSQVPLHAASSTQRRLSPPYSALPCCRCKVPSPSVMYSARNLVHAIGFQRERRQLGCSAKLRRCPRAHGRQSPAGRRHPRATMSDVGAAPLRAHSASPEGGVRLRWATFGSTLRRQEARPLLRLQAGNRLPRYDACRCDEWPRRGAERGEGWPAGH